MTSLRLFFGIGFTAEVKQALIHVIKQLKTKYPFSTIRWIQPDNLHITLQFLKAVREDDLNQLIKNVNAELTSCHSFELELGDLELFPNLSHPRVISLSINPHAIFANLAQQIGKGIIATGYDIERRSFRGHLTLAKIRSNSSFSFEDISSPSIRKMQVAEIILYQSQPSKTGSYYIPLARFKLEPAAN